MPRPPRLPHTTLQRSQRFAAAVVEILDGLRFFHPSNSHLAGAHALASQFHDDITVALRSACATDDTPDDRHDV